MKNTIKQKVIQRIAAILRIAPVTALAALIVIAIACLVSCPEVSGTILLVNKTAGSVDVTIFPRDDYFDNHESMWTASVKAGESKAVAVSSYDKWYSIYYTYGKTFYRMVFVQDGDTATVEFK